ncbi:AbrB/MazE/SpoVT family DNA-binding domain-containing protein [Candidatus Saccharibacteria bacterium]|nr:AbrB/MazE/SpoVT family DNA-binding domain-containing protein [Candidatus Saccharibacteria bacterium]
MIRKIVRIGNSDGVVIPVSVMRAHRLKVGDRVEVIIGPPGEIAKRLEFLQELEDYRKFRGQAPKKPSESQLL